jgi:hypothetical protein
MVVEVLIIAGITAAAGAVARARRRRRAKVHAPEGVPSVQAPRPRAQERAPWDITVGDVVSYVTDDFLVEAVLTYEDEGPRFREAHLSTDARLWVGAENDVVFTRPIPAPDGASSFPNQLFHDGQPYQVKRRGSAFLLGERWQFADYEAPPGRVILLRCRHGGDPEAFAGERVRAGGLFALLPGS